MHLRHAIIGELGRRLESGDALVRCLAAQALGRLGDRAAVPALLARLADEDMDVCCDAVAALGALGDRRAVPALLELYGQAPLGEFKLAALEALGRIGGAAAGALLRNVAQARDASWDALTPAEWDHYWDARRIAVGALGRLGDPAVVTVLASLLADEDGEDVAAPALAALAALGPAGAGAVCDALRAGRRRVRCLAARAAGERHLAVALPALLEALDAPDPELRAEALCALARFGASLPQAHWLRLVRDADPVVRAAAAAMSTDLPPTSHLDGLRAMASDPDGATRAAALRTLAARYPQGARDVLLTALQDPDPTVLSAAAPALVTTGDRQAHAMLCAVARNAGHALPRRLAALGALSTCPREWSTPLWHELLADEQAAVRLIALRALCGTGDARVAALLAAVLRGDVVPGPAGPVAPREPGEHRAVAPGQDTADLAEPLPAPGKRPPPRSTVGALLRPPPVAAEAGQEPASAELNESERESLAAVEEHLRLRERWAYAQRLPVHTAVRVQAGHLAGSDGVSSSREVAEALIGMLAGSDPPLRMAAAEALGRLAAPDAVEALTACLPSLDPELRLAAIRGLGRIGNADGLRAVRAGWPDRDPLVRQEQVRVLGATPDPDGAALACAALNDSEPTVVQEAIAALLERGHGASMVAVLAAVCCFPDFDWSGLGAWLQGWAGECAVQALRAVLDDPQQRGCHSLAITVLGEMARAIPGGSTPSELQAQANHG